MTDNKSTELHLDLCPERTAHLLEALSIIKENFYLVDEVLSVGLKNICSRVANENGGSTESQVLDGDQLQEDDELTGLEGKDTEEKEKHRQCCCMCSLRVSSPTKLALKSKSPASAAGKSNLPLDQKNATKKQQPGKPRLNRTASLRRESAVERRASQTEKPQPPPLQSR